jgi:N-acetylmuramic acid 6-phosphate etherase
MFPEETPATEQVHPLARGLDALPASGILRILHEENAAAMQAVGRALADIERMVKEAVESLLDGGVLYYVGAGTSGRLGVLDAAEVFPTFGDDRVRAIMAGGAQAVLAAAEGAEDDEAAGREAGGVLSGRDMALGISASGRTPFVLAALEAAKGRGARCWLLTMSPGGSQRPAFLDGLVAIETGPEIVAGSTRLKAGTATKMVLNMFSTALMAALGHVHDGLMVDVVPSNRKLLIRAEHIIREIAVCSPGEAEEFLRLSGMRPKTAVVMLKRGVPREEAERLLAEARGSLRRVLEAPKGR